MDCSLPGSSVQGISQAVTLKWVAISAWGGGGMDLPDPGIETWSSASQVDSLPTELPGKPHVVNDKLKRRWKSTLPQLKKNKINQLFN